METKDLEERSLEERIAELDYNGGAYQNKIVQGDCLESLGWLSDNTIDCVMTSPPYWALRNYNVDGQVGQETSPEEYVNVLCNIFDEVKRVLKPTGTCWVNMGDTYGGTGDKGKYEDPKWRGRNGQKKALNKNATSKCLLQIPSRFAIEMCNRGWVLRNEVIWHKPNAMPSSVKDRFTVDYEKLFLFVKDSKRYYFSPQYEPYTAPMNRWGGDNLVANGESTWDEGTGQKSYRKRNMRPNAEGRNKRCVWSINTKPCRVAHFAVFPEELCEVPLLAGCPIGGLVLDPFAGSGTTGIVANRQEKHFIGMELNPEFAEIARKRNNNTTQQKETTQ